MRTRDFRLKQNRLKDLRRRRLYRNHSINGRYEISSKEDKSVTYREVWDINLVSHWGYVTIHPSKISNEIGHWQEYPKNQNYGSRGYNLKSSKHKKIRQALKSEMRREQNEAQISR